MTRADECTECPTFHSVIRCPCYTQTLAGDVVTLKRIALVYIAAHVIAIGLYVYLVAQCPDVEGM
jgi:hypothetical protein